MARWDMTKAVVSRRGQASMVGLLIAIVIIMVAVWWIWLRPSGNQDNKPRFQGEAQTPLGKALQKGQSTECIEYLRQLRMAIQMEKDSNEQYPAALDRKWGVPLTCPVSNLPFKYDPQTGRVWDPTPGHEKF